MRSLTLLVSCCLGFLPLTLEAQTERKETVISASDLAPAALRAGRPTPGKWWLKEDAQDWGVRGGTILLTGETSGTKGSAGEWQVTPIDRFVPYVPPALVVDPKVKGWHRIHVGLLHEPKDPYARLQARLSGEPYPEYLQPPQATKGKVVEVYWKAADLTGKTIRIEPVKGPMPHPGTCLPGGITHVRLVPMSAAEVAAAKKEIELPPARQRLFGMLDYTDEVFWWGTAESEDDIRAIVYRHREAGFGRIYWRAFGSSLDNTLALREAAPRWTEVEEKAWLRSQKCKAGWLDYFGLTRKFDPLKVAVEYGKANGCEVHAWVRFTNFNRYPYANFWHDNQKFFAQMVASKTNPKTGKVEPIKPYRYSPYARVLSLAYPEVRAFYVRFFKQLASTGTPGIMIDLLRHPPIAGYEPIVRGAFKKKYGMDMEERDVYHDPLVNEHLSQYLRLFLVELRKELGKDIEISVRSSGPNKYALKGKEWIAEGLIDTIVDGHWYSGNGPRPTIAATVEAAGARGKACAIAETLDVNPEKGWGRRPGFLSPQAIRALAKHYSGKGVASFGIYESTIFTWYPETRRTIRAAGWEFDPGKR
jgi:hypothetical protein